MTKPDSKNSLSLTPRYNNDEIVIVGIGCVLPDASSPKEFWNNIKSGHSSIRPLPKDRLDSNQYLSKRGTPDKTYSNHAAFIEEEIIKVLNTKHSLDNTTRLETMTLEACDQAVTNLTLSNAQKQNTSIILGCMTQDEAISLQELRREESSISSFLTENYPEISESANAVVKTTLEAAADKAPDHKRVFFATSAIDLVKRKLNFGGEGYLIDAACASSLAAINAAMVKLRQRECDLAITGGIEANLSPETFALFAEVDLLAETKCLPLDNRTDGLTQGEGAVTFALQRLEDALKSGHKIYGVLRCCEGVNNGRSSSMFSPTIDGQLQTLQKARKSLQFDHTDYFECHATGTRIGDATELETIEQYFKHPVNVGAVKALIGHTKGAAGGAGLLKAVLSLMNRVIPPEKHFRRFIESYAGDIARVNTVEAQIPDRELPLIYGVNSAGFGGINFHTILEEFKQDHKLTSPDSGSSDSVVVVESDYLPYENARENFADYGFKIPPMSLEKIDRLQLLSLCTTKRIMNNLGINENDLPKSEVTVIASCFSGNDGASDLTWRVRHGEFQRFTKDKTIRSAIQKHKSKYPELAEDTGPGTLNSVIAGRVSNIFGFTGKSFALDCDLVSEEAAFSLAKSELRSGSSKFIILLSRTYEMIYDPITSVNTTGLKCFLLCLESTADSYILSKKHHLKTDNRATTRGAFFGEYSLLPVATHTPASTVVFTGQGSNFGEMFSDYINQFRLVDEYFQKADKIAKSLGLKRVSDYVLKPDSLSESDKDKLENLALFTGQCALYELVKSRLNPTLITGHSFGEYAAAVASQICTFEAMFRFVWAREQCCEGRNKTGFMIAAKSDRDRAETALEGIEYYFSNQNSGNQVVFSVKPDQKMVARKRLRKNQIAALILDAPHPFHSPMLLEARDNLKKHLKSSPLNAKPPVTSFFSSVSRKLITADSFSPAEFDDIMVDQLVKPVLFVDQIKEISSLGCTRFLEIGPKPVVQKFIKEISKESRLNLSSHFVDDILLKHRRLTREKRFSGRNSKTVAIVNKIISKVTGYEIDSISLGDRFQDDLGIDSIKKTEILFSVLSEMDLSISDTSGTSSFHRVVDLVDELDSVESSALSLSYKHKEREPKFECHKMEWKPKELHPFFNVSATPYTLFTSAGHGDLFKDLDLSHSGRHIIILKQSRDVDLCQSILSLKAASHDLPSKIKLALITDLKDSVGEGFGAFFKSLKKELSNLTSFKHIRYTKYNDALIDLASKELDQPTGSDILYDNECRQQLGLQNRANKTQNITKDSVFLFFGGAKGIGYSLAKSLSSKYGAVFHLCGRSTVEDEIVSKNIAELRQTNAQVFYHVVDASNQAQTKDLFELVTDKHSQIDFVINSTGAEVSKLLDQKTESEIKHELKSKLSTAESISKSSPIKPIHFSSVVSLYGNPGQSVYSLSNAIINSKAALNNESSILWPPWDGVGMMEGEITQTVKSLGLSLLQPADAATHFENAISQSGNTLIHSTNDTSSYEIALTDHSSVEDLGTLKKLSKGVNFKKTFTPQNTPWLKDHAINGTILLPAASAASMFLLGGYLLTKEFLTLTDFEVKSPVIVGESGTKLTTEFFETDATKLAQIYSNSVHFTAQLTKQPFSNSLKATKTTKKGGKQLEEIYEKNALFHGPTLQLISSVTTTANELWAEADLSVFNPKTNVQALIPMLDSAFQLLCLCALERNWSTLPTSAKIISFDSAKEITSKIKVGATKIAFEDSKINADISVYNDKDQCLLALNGASATRR